MPDCLGCGLAVENGLLVVKRNPDGHVFCNTEGLYFSNADADYKALSGVLVDSTTFGDIAGAGIGPTVTLRTGTQALAIWSARVNNSAGNAQMSVAVSGASTVAASLDHSIIAGASSLLAYTYAMLFTGLTVGINTFTAKYRTSSGATGTFATRRLMVVA